MEKRMELLPGVTLTAVQTEKFKTGCFSINFFRPLRREEAAMNALIPSVLLRGSEGCPDLRAIAARLDELYGASAGTLIRKKGEVQMTGFYADFIEDALAGEPVFAPMMDFLGELLLRPRLENGAFLAEYVESEKRNLANAIASRVNDKRTYATGQLVKTMCAGEAYAVPRLGELEDVEPITPEGLYAQYRKVLAESRVELFYMGRKSAEDVAEQLRRAGIAAPRADELALSGKSELCFGMEGGLYLGRIALQRPICADAQETVQALSAQGLSVVLPAGREPLLTRQLAARIGASPAEQGGQRRHGRRSKSREDPRCCAQAISVQSWRRRGRS